MHSIHVLPGVFGFWRCLGWLNVEDCYDRDGSPTDDVSCNPDAKMSALVAEQIRPAGQTCTARRHKGLESFQNVQTETLQIKCSLPFHFGFVDYTIQEVCGKIVFISQQITTISTLSPLLLFIQRKTSKPLKVRDL